MTIELAFWDRNKIELLCVLNDKIFKKFDNYPCQQSVSLLSWSSGHLCVSSTTFSKSLACAIFCAPPNKVVLFFNRSFFVTFWSETKKKREKCHLEGRIQLDVVWKVTYSRNWRRFSLPGATFLRFFTQFLTLKS